MSYTYEYPRPALTVDCVVFGMDEEDLKVLLIKRGLEPFLGKWALPGGFVRMDESLDAAARRELEEEAGIRPSHLEQLYSFGEPGRDPRGRVVTVAYFALVPHERLAGVLGPGLLLRPDEDVHRLRAPLGGASDPAQGAPRPVRGER